MPARAEGGSKLVPDLERGISKKTLFPNHSPPLRVNSERGEAVEKVLVGRMAFTPLTRGARGVGFQPREGERDG